MAGPSLSARRAWIEINVGFPIAAFLLSLSARRAWIEIDWARSLFRYLGVALRKESVDRNHGLIKFRQVNVASLSARRAWIEISPPLRLLTPAIVVALRKESVDRNVEEYLNAGSLDRVALRKESVDRNSISRNGPPGRLPVALRKESVDRNQKQVFSEIV